jgi:hypothetical protein
MGSSRTRRLLLALALGGLAALALGAGWWWNAQRGREVVFAVPAGTAARLEAGEAVQVLPQTIRLRQNDTLIIRNDDTAMVQIGPFPVAPGQRFVQQYYNRGTYTLVCSFHGGEDLKIVVE